MKVRNRVCRSPRARLCCKPELEEPVRPVAGLAQGAPVPSAGIPISSIAPLLPPRAVLCRCLVSALKDAAGAAGGGCNKPLSCNR